MVLPAGFDAQGGLNKDATMTRRRYNGATTLSIKGLFVTFSI